MNNRKQNIGTVELRMGGEIICRVIKDGKVLRETKPTKNLVLYGGIERAMTGNTNWQSQVGFCRAGTGTTANSESRDGTYARSGTTVTRSTGTGTFSAGDVGKTIKFGSGEEAYISAYTSATEVTTRESGTIAATSIVVWDTARTALDSQAKETSTLDGGAGSNSVTVNNPSATVAYKRTYNFAAEVGSVSYTEIGFSNNTGVDLFSRIVLGSAVNVNAGEQLQVQYTLTMEATGFVTSQAVDPTITGWPYPYTISGITHGGASFDVTLTEDHHYTAGDEITIADAVPTKAAIDSISSTVSDFTVTTDVAHGLSTSDSIEIENCSVGAYNGTWTVASVGSTTEFTVTSAANPGAASDGTARKSTPGTYFNGTWTIASVPSAAVVRITDATISTGTPAGEGDLEGSLAGDARFCGSAAFYDDTANAGRGGVLEMGAVSNKTAWLYRSGEAPTLDGLGSVPGSTGQLAATRAESVTMDTNEHTMAYSTTWDIDEANHDDLRAVVFSGTDIGECGLIVLFDQNQRKDSGYSLELGYTTQVRPTLA